MSENNSYQLKNPISIRLNDEECQFANEMILEMNPEYTKFTTARTMFYDLVQRASEKFKLKTQARPEDAEQIQLLQNEIGRLKIQIDQLKEENQDQKEFINAQGQTLIEEQTRAQTPTPPQNQEVLTLEPIICVILDIERKQAQEKTGKQFSRGELLTGLYWSAVKDGRAYPYKIWSNTELAKIAIQLKEKGPAK